MMPFQVLAQTPKTLTNREKGSLPVIGTKWTREEAEQQLEKDFPNRDKSCQTNNQKLEACDKALKDADDLIQKQYAVLQQVQAQNLSLKDENEQLSNAIVKLDQEIGQTWKDQALIGLLGIGVGITLGILIPH